MPCGTCDRSGIACEGLTERKRPKKTTCTEQRRAHTSSTQIGTSPPSIPQPPSRENADRSLSREDKSGNATTPNRRGQYPCRPTAALKKLNTVNSDDSGYSSGRQSRLSDVRTPRRSQPSPLLPINHLADYDNSAETSPLTMEPQDWSFVMRSHPTSYCSTEAAESDISHSTHVASATPSAKSVEWPEPEDRASWWRDNNSHGQAATNLISAAQVLEEQAQSLRRLASRQDSEVMEDTRRQTIVFPLHPTSSNTSNCPSETQPGAFDDMALLLSERTSGSGITPRACDFASWWDVNPDLTASMGLHQHPSVSLSPGFAAPSAVETADTGWPFHPADLPTNAISPHETARDRHSSNTSSATLRQTMAAQGYASAADSYPQLYPWPE